MLEKEILNYYDFELKLDEKLDFKEIETILSISNINLKNKLFNKILNDEHNILKTLRQLEELNMLDELENIKIESTLNLLVLYSLFVHKNQIKKTFDLSKIANQIINKLDLNSEINIYGYDFLFFFCLNQNIDFKKYSFLLKDTRYVFDYELQFNEKIINLKNSENSIQVNISKFKNSFNLGLYISERHMTSSSMKFNDINEHEIFNYIDFNTIDILKFFEYTNYSDNFLSENIQFNHKLKRKKEDTNWELVLKKVKVNKFGIIEHRIDTTIREEFDLTIIKSIDKKFDLILSDLKYDDKLYLFDQILKNSILIHKYRKTAFQYILYMLLSTGSELKYITMYKNILKLTQYIYINDVQNFEQVSQVCCGYNNSNKFPDIMIELSKHINQNFINKIINSIKDNSIPNKIKIIKVLVETDASKFVTKTKIKKILEKNFDLFNLILISLQISESYFHDIYKEYKDLFKLRIVQEILFEYLLRTNDFQKIIGFYKLFPKVKNNKKFINFIENNKDFFVKLNKVFFHNILLEKNLIEEKDFINLLILKLNSVKDLNISDYINYIQKRKDFNIILDSLKIEVKFKVLFLNQEYDKCIDLINKNTFDLLSNRNILELILEEIEIKNIKPFLDLLVTYNQNIEIVSTILKIAKKIDIDINEYYTKKYYYIFEEDLNMIFEA